MRKPGLFIEDMLIALRNIGLYLGDMSLHDFIADTKTHWAVVKQLEILGEAAKRVPKEVREEFPLIDWKDFAKTRDRLSHGYFDLDFDLIWEIAHRVVESQLKVVEQAVQEMLREDCGKDNV